MEESGESVREVSVAKGHGGEINVGSSAQTNKYFFLLGSCCQSFAAGVQHNLLTISIESSKHNVLSSI